MRERECVCVKLYWLHIIYRQKSVDTQKGQSTQSSSETTYDIECGTNVSHLDGV